LTGILPWRDILQTPLSHRERGDHYTGRVRDTAGTPRSESGWLKNTATVSRRSLNIAGAEVRGVVGIRLATVPPGPLQKAQIWRELAGFVLNAPLSSAICR
jgi:hypothetical protein